MKNCKSLVELPKEMSRLNSLEELVLFSEMKNSKFTSFTLPHSLTTLNLSRTPICFLPRSIKDIEIPSSLVGLDVSYCYSLQRIANLIPFTIARDCDQLVHIQDWIKLELIQKVDSHLLRIMEMVSVQMQTWRFQIELQGNRFNVVLEYDENEMLGFYEEEGLI
uniref:Uncharacterized protein n=1 Tax=Populus trichocarpa TaxID=3694 RepID=A0A2K1YE96_POPTR